MSGEIPAELETMFSFVENSPTQTDREPVKLLVIGSRQSVNKTVHHLHQLQFAEFNEWSRLLPAPVAGQVMRILIRYLAKE